MFSSRLFSAESAPPAAQTGAGKASPNTAAQPGQGTARAEDGKFADAFQSVAGGRGSQATAAKKPAENSPVESTDAAAATPAGDAQSQPSPEIPDDAAAAAATDAQSTAGGQESGEEPVPEAGEAPAASAQAGGASMQLPDDSGPDDRQNNDEKVLDPSRKRQIMDDGDALLSRLAAAEQQLAGAANTKAQPATAQDSSNPEQTQAGKQLPPSTAAEIPSSAAAGEPPAALADSASGRAQAGEGYAEAESLRAGRRPDGADADAALVLAPAGQMLNQARASGEPEALAAQPPPDPHSDEIQLDDAQLAALARLSGQAQGVSVSAEPDADLPVPEGKNAQALSRQQAEWLQAVAQKVKAATGAEPGAGQATLAATGPGPQQAGAEAVSGALASGTPGAGTWAAASLSGAGSVAGTVMPGMAPASAEGAADAGQAALSQAQAEALTAGTLTQGAAPHGGEGRDAGRPEMAQAAAPLGQQQSVTANPLRAEAAQAQTPLMLSKEQAGEQLAERVQVMVAKNLKHVDIRLDPPELGRLQIKLSLNQDQASVQFHVGNAQTRELVEQAMPRLRELMNQQGLQLAQSSVQQDSSRQQFAGQSGQQQQTNTGQSGSGQSGGQPGHSGGHAQQADGEPLEMYVSQPTDRVDYYA